DVFDGCRVHTVHQSVESLRITDAEIGEHVVAECVEDIWELADAADTLELGLECDDDLLLAAAACEVRSLSVVAVARPRVDERVGAVHVLHAGVEMNLLIAAIAQVALTGRVLVVREPDRDIDIDTADSVDRLLEGIEVDSHEIVDADPEEM